MKNMAVKNNKKNQQGQALLFVIVTMTIALALGVGLSLDTISSISNVATTDTYQKSLSAAEGAAERVLLLDDAVLDTLKDGITSSECTAIPGGVFENSTCYIKTQPLLTGGANPDTVATKASIEVSEYSLTTPESSQFDIPAHGITEFSLVGYGKKPLAVCWDGNTSVYIKVYTSDASGNYSQLMRCRAGVGACEDSGWEYGAGYGEAGPGGAAGYQQCALISAANMPNNAQGLRIRSLGSAISGAVAFLNASDRANFPIQGYKIEAKGTLENVSDVRRDVVVYKSFSYSPIVMDFSLYAEDKIGLN